MLGVTADRERIELDGGEQVVVFVSARRDEVERIVEIRCAAPSHLVSGQRGAAQIAGVRFTCEEVA
jgi:hypothetical protein